MSYKITMMHRHEAAPECHQPDEYDYSTALVISDNGQIRYYTDGGAPEDNTFTRDWSWVRRELENAYRAGLRDGGAA